MWKPINDLVVEEKLYLVLIPIDDFNKMVMLAVYNSSIDSWMEMTGRHVENKHVTHYAEYEQPSEES